MHTDIMAKSDLADGQRAIYGRACRCDRGVHSLGEDPIRILRNLTKFLAARAVRHVPRARSTGCSSHRNAQSGWACSCEPQMEVMVLVQSHESLMHSICAPGCTAWCNNHTAPCRSRGAAASQPLIAATGVLLQPQHSRSLDKTDHACQNHSKVRCCQPQQLLECCLCRPSPASLHSWGAPFSTITAATCASLTQVPPAPFCSRCM